MGKTFIISFFTKDRIGIIADITGTIFNLGGDLQDLNQAVLRGYFSMILIAELNEKYETNELKKNIAENFVNDEEPEPTISVREITDSNSAKSRENLHKRKNSTDEYVLTAECKNRSGLVAQVSEFCKQNFINIIFLSTKLSRDNKYAMMFLVDLQNVTSLKEFRKNMKKFSEDSGIKVVLQHNDIFEATNELKY